MSEFLTWGIIIIPWNIWGCLCGVGVKAIDCGTVVNKFKLQSHYYIHFQTNTLGKGKNPLILPAMGKIVPLPFFKKDAFGIK